MNDINKTNDHSENIEKSENGFSYTYSAPTENERRQIESIRRQYVTKEYKEDKAERVRMLHARVVNSATAISLIFGVVGLLVFGVGMTCVLEWDRVVIGVLIGALGALIMAPAYPIYNYVLNKNKKKYGEEIVRLSDELLGEGEKQ